MASQKKSTSGRKTKKERMEEMERVEAFRKEIILWIIVAVSLVLFISNFGVGGIIGNGISGFIFGLFGLIAYVFPIILLAGSFFAVSNKGNAFAILKLAAAILFAVFLCVLFSLITYGSEVVPPLLTFVDSRDHKNGGGIVGGSLAFMLVKAFGIIGSYIIDIIVLIIALVLITGKSAMKGMKKGGQKVYESAKENNERYQEYREYKSKERASRRMDNKISGVSIDTKIVDTTISSLPTDEMGEIHIETYPEQVKEEAVVEEKITPLFPEPSQADTIDAAVAQTKVLSRKKAAISSDGMVELYPDQELQNHDEKKPMSELEHSDNFSNIEIHEESEPRVWNPSDEIEDVPEEQVSSIDEIDDSQSASQENDFFEKKTFDEIGVDEEPMEMGQEVPVATYQLPTPDLLKQSDRSKRGDSQSQLQETAMKLQQTLKNFGVDADVTDYSCGPAVTRYEIHPKMGVKVSKIVNLADDIKLNLAAADIRIEAPIPGKAAVGIEVPNKENVMVSFRDLIESKEFQDSKSKISFAVGKDIAGKTMVTDIAKMPHLLIAGATGSGKSVCINTIIMSILFKAKPDEVKLIMIDPKVVELSVYNGIPHLMIPVVTDPKKAAGALNWAVAEMTDRYNKFAEVNVRNMAGYNAKIDSIEVPEGQERPKKMPQIVIIVDELADLMMVASKEVEESICRLAQLARAAGIHLIIATQRPSVNVITGLIKANMPSRIAFAVTSGIDSRTILDMNGAEKLLGKGDMLFNPQGAPKPMRVQGAFISDPEVQAVVDFIIEQNGNAEYSNEMQQKMESMQNDSNTVTITEDIVDDGRDSYFIEAAKILIDKDRASIGMLQRYLKVGFNRAARIMDQLSEAGIVGPEEGTKPRKVLMSPEEFETFLEENS